MKKLACLVVALCLVLGILLIAVADVNHGHGPGHYVEEGQGDEVSDHGEAGDGEDTSGEENTQEEDPENSLIENPEEHVEEVPNSGNEDQAVPE